MPAEIPETHPRHRSLVTRERLVAGCEAGLVSWHGLVAHGRGEAFDYLLGEVSPEAALEAARAAAAHLLRARRGVLSVNGNVAILAPEGVRELAEATGARVEVNLFHRTEDRVRKLVAHLQEAGIPEVLGREADARIPGLDHPRGLCSREGIHAADVVLVPLEDGDRAEALVAMGKVVLAVDLNPLSRTSRTATVAVVDEVTRALRAMTVFAREAREDPGALRAALDGYRKEANLRRVLDHIRENLERWAGGSP